MNENKRADSMLMNETQVYGSENVYRDFIL